MRLIDADNLDQYAYFTEQPTYDAPYGGDYVVKMDDIENATTINPEDLRPKWISVEERLPNYGEIVLVMSRWGVDICKADADEDGTFLWDCGEACLTKEYAPYWMPLPELPCGAKMEGWRMCEYCHEDKDGYVRQIPRKGNGQVYIHHSFVPNKWVLIVSQKYKLKAEIEIQYCPMCGRKLKG